MCLCELIVLNAIFLQYPVKVEQIKDGPIIGSKTLKINWTLKLWDVHNTDFGDCRSVTNILKLYAKILPHKVTFWWLSWKQKLGQDVFVAFFST